MKGEHTRTNPGPVDYHALAEPDEPMFVLLARDPLAPVLVRLWAELRAATEIPNRAEMLKRQHAIECADQMDAWRTKHRPGKRLINTRPDVRRRHGRR